MTLELTDIAIASLRPDIDDFPYYNFWSLECMTMQAIIRKLFLFFERQLMTTLLLDFEITFFFKDWYTKQ